MLRPQIVWSGSVLGRERSVRRLTEVEISVRVRTLN